MPSRSGTSSFQPAVSRPLPECERCVNRTGTACADRAGRGCHTLDRMERQQRVRAAHGRGARRPAHPAVVHRRARPAEVVRHLPGRARERLRRGHDTSTARPSTGYSRVQESDVLAKPDPNTFELLPVGRRPTAPSARMFCDIENLDGTPFEGDPRQVLRRNLDRAREQGLHVLRRPRDGVLLLRRRRPDASRPSRSTTAGVLRPDHRRRRQRPAQADDPHARGDGHPGRVHASTRTRPSQHEIDLRYTDALTMADNVMTFRLVVKEIALEHGVYATFMPKPLDGRAGLGHAHPLLAVRGRHQRLPRPRRRARPVEGRPAASSPACCTTPARSPRSPTSGSTPTSGWSSATRRRSTCRWARNNRSALVRVPAVKRGKDRRRPASSTGRPIRPATRTSRSR